MTLASVSAPKTGTAIILFCFGIFCFAANDALGKWLVGQYPVGEIMLIRSAGAALVLVPMLFRHAGRLAIPARPWLHGLRILALAGDTFAFYDATRTLPLADVMTFYLAAPLFVTVLAVLLLGERIGAFRVAALLLGFAGVVVALHPAGPTVSAGAAVAVAGSFLFATAMVITRTLRRSHWLLLVTGQFAGAGLIGAAVSGFAWVTPGLFDAGLMLLVGLVSMTCFLCINRALSLAEASVLAPFHYTSIVWAVLLGWLVWGDLPTLAMAAGIGLIVASGAAVWWHERTGRAVATVAASVV